MCEWINKQTIISFNFSEAQYLFDKLQHNMPHIHILPQKKYFNNNNNNNNNVNTMSYCLSLGPWGQGDGGHVVVATAASEMAKSPSMAPPPTSAHFPLPHAPVWAETKQFIKYKQYIMLVIQIPRGQGWCFTLAILNTIEQHFP